MIARVALMLMVCGMASAGIVPVSEADILSDLMANPPLAPTVGRQGPTARPANKPVLRQSRVAYQDARPQSRTVLITPGGTRSMDRRVADRPVPAASPRQRANDSIRPLTRQAVASDLRFATASHVTKPVRVATRQTRVMRAKTSYRQNRPRGTQPLLARAYTQPPQAAYAPQYSPQPAYAAAPNYYQGYAYRGWNATNPAACAPGRA